MRSKNIPKPAKEPRVSVRVNDALLKRLAKVAEDNKRSTGFIVREAIDFYLPQLEKKAA